MMIQPTPKPRAKIGDVVVINCLKTASPDPTKIVIQATVIGAKFEQEMWIYSSSYNDGYFMDENILYNLTTGETYD